MSDRVDLRQETVDQLFEDNAAYWTDVYSEGRLEALVYQERRDRAFRAVADLELRTGASILELGSGAGELAVMLARAGYTVTATDTADAMLERTAQRAASEGLTLAVQRADTHELPFGDESFDAVVALGVLPWLHSPGRALAELARVLRPGGFVLLSADNARRLNELLDPWLTWLLAPPRRSLRRRLEARGRASGATSRRHTRSEVERMLGEAGLAPVFSQAIGFGPFTLVRRAFLPHSLGLAVNTRLQAWADRGAPLLRGAGVHHLVLAQKSHGRSPGPRSR
jgi:ubiquinone/menaquinone biosynthesis C-methylase UbiE